MHAKSGLRVILEWKIYRPDSVIADVIQLDDMPTIIRRIIDDRLENYADVASDSWDLRTQIEALEQWLIDHPNELDSSQRWIADVGFTVRLEATGGGPPITRKLMKLCVESNLEIYLSEYGAEIDA